MNKIPQFFRKSKSQTGEAETSPTKEILTPAELEKLTRKVKSELASAELRIDYIKGRQHCPKEGDSREIERLEADIAGLELKYKDLLDPNFVIYKQRKEQRATPSGCHPFRHFFRHFEFWRFRHQFFLFRHCNCLFRHRHQRWF